MLNKCLCGEGGFLCLDATEGNYVECLTNLRARLCAGSTAEESIAKWNNQNPTPTPEEFEDRFATAYSLSIGGFVDLKTNRDEVLREFKDSFGFDLKEVAKEQWTKHKGN